MMVARPRENFAVLLQVVEVGLQVKKPARQEKGHA